MNLNTYILAVLGVIIFAFIISLITYYLTTGKGFQVGNWFTSLRYNTGYMVYTHLSIIISFILATSFVLLVNKQLSTMSYVVISILTFLIYLIYSSARSSGLNLSISPVTYPTPPHLGLDGVSLENIYPNKIGYRE